MNEGQLTAIKLSQQTAINKYMQARKRYLTSVKRSYPKYRDGMTTWEYINQFSQANDKATVNLLPFAI